jgi:hypothetical protein
MAMNTQKLEKGSVVWIPCEVRGGPFPDERMVHVDTGMSEWFGFVNVSELKNKVATGKDSVRCVVLAVERDYLVVGIEGQSPTTSGSIQAQPSFIEHGAV